MDYETFNYWLERKVMRYYTTSTFASHDQLTIFMSPKDYSKFLRMLQENLTLTQMFDVSKEQDIFSQCEYRGVTVRQCVSIKDNEYKMYVEL